MDQNFEIMFCNNLTEGTRAMLTSGLATKIHHSHTAWWQGPAHTALPLKPETRTRARTLTSLMLTFIICLLNETVLHHVSTNTTLEVGLCSSRTRVLFLCQWSLPATRRPLSPPHPHTTPPVSNARINRKWDFMVEQIRGPVHTHLNSEHNSSIPSPVLRWILWPG